MGLAAAHLRLRRMLQILHRLYLLAALIVSAAVNRCRSLRRVDSYNCAAIMEAALAAALPSAPLAADTPTLVCARCRASIAAPPDIMTEACNQGRGTLWYPHELDLLDMDDVPTFGGAKDPTGDSHDVARGLLQCNVSH